MIDTMEKTTTTCRGDDDEDLLLPVAKADLIQEILLRLPVTSLLRFKSVSKSWFALIQTSFFIHLHTTFNSSSSSSNKFGSFVLLASVEKQSPTSVYWDRLREFALVMLSSESVSGDYWWSTTSLGFPPCYYSKVYANFSPTEIVGSCNGLICLYDRDDHKDISLWNPATRQFRILPKTFITIDDEECPLHLVAFGFDVEAKDYKVLLVTCFQPKHHDRPAAPGEECLCQVYVYSLSTDSWKLLEGITCLPGFPLYNNAIEVNIVYQNGSCFFMAHFLHTKQLPQNDRFLISFDFTKEIFIPMQLPYHHRHHRDRELYLSSLGDKIALFTATCYAEDNYNSDTRRIRDEDYKFYPGFCSQVFDIWVLNEHGGGNISSSVNKESWTKLHSFRIDRKRQGEWILPRGISNDGEFAMLETRSSAEVGKKMELYNLVTKQVKKSFLSCSSVMSKANAYQPSLVSIIGGNGTTSADKVIGNGATGTNL